LAVELKAELFVILTQVDKVYINYKSDHQQPLERAKLDYLKELYDQGHFPAGSMGPRFWLPSSTWKTLMARLQSVFGRSGGSSKGCSWYNNLSMISNFLPVWNNSWCRHRCGVGDGIVVLAVVQYLRDTGLSFGTRVANQIS